MKTFDPHASRSVLYDLSLRLHRTFFRSPNWSKKCTLRKKPLFCLCFLNEVAAAYTAIRFWPVNRFYTHPHDGFLIKNGLLRATVNPLLQLLQESKRTLQTKERKVD